MKYFLRVSFIILTVISFSHAQNFNLTGAGARAEGFGGAFIGLADDATAVVWNPAGLSQLERAEGSLVTRYISEQAEFKDAQNSSFDTKESQSYFSLNFGSIAMPVTLGGSKVVVAFAYQRQLDFFGNTDLKYSWIDDSGDLITLDVKNTIRGGVNTITPAIGYKLSPMFSLGLSVNIWTGSIDSKEKTIITKNNNSLEIDNNIDGNYSGFNLVIGALVDFESGQKGTPLKIGATMRTPFTLKGDINVTEINELADEYEQKVTQNIEMPFMLGLGASYRVSDNLTFAADYEIRSYADKKITESRAGSEDISFALTENNKNLNEFRIGAEYLFILDKGVIPLRLGFKSVPTVLSDKKYNAVTDEYVSDGNQVVGATISLGSGYISDLFAFDITYSSSAYTQKYDADSKIDFLIGTLSTSVIIYF